MGESRLDLVSHEIGHIVEGASHGLHESPAFEIWKDSKWIELYQYDLYAALGLDREARHAGQKFTRQADDFPRPGTQWFRDFFHPLWREHGRARLMVNFFGLLAKHFPQEREHGGTHQRYTRRMNWGEFILFMTGVAGADVRPIAKKAFGWPAEWEDNTGRLGWISPRSDPIPDRRSRAPSALITPPPTPRPRAWPLACGVRLPGGSPRASRDRHRAGRRQPAVRRTRPG